jgi:hypothetical protein
MANDVEASGSVPLASETTEFDLSQEADRERVSKRKTYGPYIIIYAFAGVFAACEGAYYLLFVDHSASDRLVDWAWIGAGVAIIAVGSYAVHSLGKNEVSKLVIDVTGLKFTRKNGKMQTWNWNSPTLHVDLCKFETSPEKVIPKDDARLVRPYWVNVYEPPSKTFRVQTTVPPYAIGAIAAKARNSGVIVRNVRVAFYWRSAPKTPGSLDMEMEGRLTHGRKVNGTVTQLRSASEARDA